MQFDKFVKILFLNKEHVVYILFDIEKAYNTIWKYSVMKDLYGMDFFYHKGNEWRHPYLNFMSRKSS